MEEYNPGFGFYDTFWRAVECLPIEEAQENLYALVKYGITGEIVDSKTMPHGYSFVMNNRDKIDYTVNRWITNVDKATMKMDAEISRNRQIAQLIIEGLASKAIGERLGVSDSTIRKTQVWKDRKLPNFCEKYGIKTVNCDSQNSQMSQDNSSQNVNDSRENVRESCENERENSQKNVNNSQEGNFVFNF